MRDRELAVIEREEERALEAQVAEAVEMALADSDKTIVQAARGCGATNEVSVSIVIQELHIHK